MTVQLSENEMFWLRRALDIEVYQHEGEVLELLDWGLLEYKTLDTLRSITPCVLTTLGFVVLQRDGKYDSTKKLYREVQH